MKPLERNFILPTTDFILVLWMALKIVLPPIKHGNIYLNISFTLLAVSLLLLGIFYFTPLFYKKWYRWFSIIMSVVLFFCLNTEVIMYYPIGFWTVLSFNHFILFIVCLTIILTNYKIQVNNKLLWIMLIFFIPIVGSMYFLIWCKCQIEKSSEKPTNAS